MATTADSDDLTGRINGIGQALLRLTAELEMKGLIDGPRVSAAWLRAAAPFGGPSAAHRSTTKVLQQLADLLDEARQSRLDQGQSPAHQQLVVQAPGPLLC